MPTQTKNGKSSIHVLEILGNAIVGGMEQYVLNLIRQLPADRFTVSCVCPFAGVVTDSLRRLGCDLYFVPMADDPAWRSIQMVAQIVQQNKVDVIHAHLPKAHTLAGLVGCLTQTPTVATLHGMVITRQDVAVSRLTGSHLITVCQEAYYEALTLGVAANKLSLIRNGVDLERFSPQGDGQAFRAAANIPADVPLVGFVGRLAWEKGPDWFMRAAARVAATHPTVHFVVVGEGPMAGELANRVKEEHLEERIHLVGLQTDTWDIYPALDVWVQTSRVEGMPLALLEAMACGRAVVAMAVGGVIEQVETDKTGLVAPQGDWEDVSRKLLLLLNNPEQAQRMGQAGRARVEAFFDLQTTVRQTGDLLNRLAKSGRAGQSKTVNQHPALHSLR